MTTAHSAARHYFNEAQKTTCAASNQGNPYCAADKQSKLYKFINKFTEKIRPELL
jgi:hypothetical protein